MRIKVERVRYEVVDVETADVFHAYTPAERDDYKDAIELVNHRAIVKEVKI